MAIKSLTGIPLTQIALTTAAILTAFGVATTSITPFAS